MSEDEMKRWAEARAAAQKRHDKVMKDIHATLRRGVRMSIEDDRRERVRRQESEVRTAACFAELAATQQETGRMLQSLLEDLRAAKNRGKGPPLTNIIDE
jgi:hypothetical protein